jgi:Prokaryotic membrane lipoprotein lipid attachment site
MKRLFLFASALLLLSGCDFLEIDKCLDRGGKWNYEKKICEFTENPQPNSNVPSGSVKE